MKLFAFGSNGSGQLGIGHTEDVSHPSPCLFTASAEVHDEKVIHIVAGGNHTLLLTGNGHVYAAGCNTDGRCGPNAGTSGDQQLQDYGQHQSEETQAEKDAGAFLLRFRRIILVDSTTGLKIDTFKCISATWEGSVLVASVRKSDHADDDDAYEDRIFVLGSSPKGELGLGSSVNPAFPVAFGTSIPKFPPEGTRIMAVASGMGHSVVVLSNGAVYGWGASRKGQLGDALKARKIVWAPERVEGIPFTATGAVCGREFTVISGRRDRGEFVVLGDKTNRWGILDIPDSLMTPTESDRPSKNYMYIGASWHGIYVHAASAEKSEDESSQVGTLIAWGRNDRGQLPPADLPPPVKVAVGSEHVVALLQDGLVATIGWGEHGNCGPETDSRGNVSGSFNTISIPGSAHTGDERIVGVGAGCATSWMIVE